MQEARSGFREFRRRRGPGILIAGMFALLLLFWALGFFGWILRPSDMDVATLERWINRALVGPSLLVPFVICMIGILVANLMTRIGRLEAAIAELRTGNENR